MKLGIFMYSLSGGGAERQFLYLLSHCAKQNIDVCLILMNKTVMYELPKNVAVHYIENSSSTENGIMKAIKIPFLAYTYSRLIKKLEVTHSVSLLTRPNFINIIASKLTNHNFKLIINELAFPSLEYGYKNFQSTFNKSMIRLLYNKADLVICNSYGNAKDLNDNFNLPVKKTKVVHNPIDLDKIEKVNALDGFYDNELFNMITIGRIDQGKNHALLINAIHKLNNANIKLYIFGEGILREALEKQIEELNLQKQVILMGFDPNPFKFLKGANLFVFGSNHEGFPNVVLEAMACGLPILTTNCKSGPSEILNLKTAEKNLMITDYGILVPVKNTDLMVEGMRYFLNNKDYLATCKINVLKRIKDFEKDKILDKYIETIKTAI